MTKVSIKHLSGLSETARRWKLDLTNDVWNGKPPFRFIEIEKRVVTRPMVKNY